MTVALFKRMSFVFEQVNADQTLFVTLNEAHGLTFTKDKALKAKTADIACYVLSKLDAVIQNPSLQNKKFEKSFYSNVVDYFEAESLDKPLLALIRSCLYASEMKVKTKRNDFVDFVAGAPLPLARYTSIQIHAFFPLMQIMGLLLQRIKP